jgi:hypothetical protein
MEVLVRTWSLTHSTQLLGLKLFNSVNVCVRTVCRCFLLNKTVFLSCSGIEVKSIGLLIMYELNRYSNPLKINTCYN